MSNTWDAYLQGQDMDAYPKVSLPSCKSGDHVSQRKQHGFSSSSHLAKNIAWAARLYFSSPGGSKCFSTSTQSSSITLKAWPELQTTPEDNLADDLKRGKHLCILQNKVCNWICSFFASCWLIPTILKYWNNIFGYSAAGCFSVWWR